MKEPVRRLASALCRLAVSHGSRRETLNNSSVAGRGFRRKQWLRIQDSEERTLLMEQRARRTRRLLWIGEDFQCSVRSLAKQPHKHRRTWKTIPFRSGGCQATLMI